MRHGACKFLAKQRVTKDTTAERALLSSQPTQHYPQRSMLTIKTLSGSISLSSLHNEFIGICKKECFQENILRIGLPVLYRVFSMGDCDLVRDHFSEVFPFLQQCVDEHFGTCASVLFTGTDARQLKLDQLSWMETSKNFDHGFITKWPLKVIIDQRIKIERYEQMISEMKLINPVLGNIPQCYGCAEAWFKLRQKYADIIESETEPS